MADQKTYLELSEEGGGAHKFYEVTVSGTSVTIRYGRIGDAGQSKTQAFAAEADALKDAAKKLDEKRRKGYAPAVQGGRTKRQPARRELQSAASTATQSPVLWRLQTGDRAFGLFASADRCWVGNESGSVYTLDHEGKVLDQVRLRDGVKCLVADEAWLYAGSDDGKVYDLGGKTPRVAYEISEDVDIYWLDIRDAVLGVSDALGNVTTINHEEQSRWSRRSSGRAGWMVRCDELGLYHGHSAGVTMYDWEDGSALWHRATSGAVMFGWQEESSLYVGTTDRKVHRFTKRGEVGVVYECDATIFSCAAAHDGRHVFAGDAASSIYCFDGSGKRLWKLATGCGSAFSMHPIGDRLFITTTDGVVACIDASEAAITAAQAGKVPQARALRAPAPVAAADPRVLQQVTSTGTGVLLECFREGASLHVRAASAGLDPTWRVQFPKELRQEGARYVVDEVRAASRGGFYRVLGEIRRLT
jgi:predicted DNA-binding WGR domain protein